MIRSATLTLALILGLTAPGGAQTFENLSLDVFGNVITATGGESPRVGMSTGPLTVDKLRSGAISVFADRCYPLAVTPRPNLEGNAIIGWLIDLRPLKVDGDAVTFHLSWVRSREGGKDLTGPRTQMQVTLKVGETMPIDLVPLPAAVKTPPDPCGVTATSIRVSVNAFPRPEQDRRLVATDLWLIEHLPNGTERSQPLSLRGLFNQPTRFFFDTVTDSGVALDFFGEFTVRPGTGALTMTLLTRSRLTQNGSSSIEMRVERIPGRTMFGARQVESTINLAPNAVVAVELPRLAENDGGAFANRAFSIRVRSRQIR